MPGNSSASPGNTTHRHAAPGIPGWCRLILFLVIVAGLVLRVAYPNTTVFCEDQSYACALAEDIAGGHFESAGLVNSGDFRNLPGFTYIMAAVWWVWPSPTALLLFISVANVLTVLASGYLMYRWVGATAALWGLAFLASAPWAIHYSRWIWSQHLLFPAALLVYVFLWDWLSNRRKWSAFDVIVSLTVLVHIHLIGVVVALAVGLLLLWVRPKLPLGALLAGVAVAIASVVPYLLDGNLGSPDGQRFGYGEFWRVFVGMCMNVSGLGWQLEFRAGYDAFTQALSWRRWPYEVIMCLPAILLLISVIAAIVEIRRRRKHDPDYRRRPLAIITALVILVPLSFDLLGMRTSPTYLPAWYPLPFVLMGWMMARVTERHRAPRLRHAARIAAVIVVSVQLLFFAEQLQYQRSNRGVPGALLGRGYAGAKEDIATLADTVNAAEIWMQYEGKSIIQGDPAAYLLRHAPWKPNGTGRALVRFRWGEGTHPQQSTVEFIREGESPPQAAYLVYPWRGNQQRGGLIPRRPAPDE